MALAACEIVWLDKLMTDLALFLFLPVLLYCDNMAHLHIANNVVYHEQTKHVDQDCYTIQENIDAGLIKTMHVTTQHQLADILTKPLYHAVFNGLISKLGVSSIFLPSSTGGILTSIYNQLV